MQILEYPNIDVNSLELSLNSVIFKSSLFRSGDDSSHISYTNVSAMAVGCSPAPPRGTMISMLRFREYMVVPLLIAIVDENFVIFVCSLEPLA